MDDLCQLTIRQAYLRLKRRECTSIELTEASLARLRHIEDKIHSCVTITAELALHQARQADKRIAAGRHHPLTGIPLLIKDNICTKGIRTTCSSRMLENFVPPYDATVIRKLHRQGTVILGKTNLDEFAMGSSTEHSAFFTTRNPWDTSRVPGGSSGGSAAAVAAYGALGALGSDTGGSVRLPAGFCNVTGLKPTYGRVSRYGLVAFASSLDQIGPLTQDVTDCAILLNAIAGHDARDSTSVPRPVPDYTRSLTPDLKGLRLGVPQEYLVSGAQKETIAVFHSAVSKLQELGAQIDWEVSLPHTSHALAAYYILAPAEASANLARYDGVKYGFSYQKTKSMWEAMEKTHQYGFGPEVKRRIMLGTYTLSAGYYDAYYLKAQKVRTLIRQEFERAFQKFDALITPTSPTVPFKIGEKVDDPLQMYLSDVCTLPVNIAGIPGLSVPAGFVAGLPVGMQILGPHFSEETLLRIGYAFEQATDWHKRRPLL